MNQYLQGTLTILSLVNPVICAAIFAKISVGKSRSAKVADATKAALSIAIILSLAALGGSQLLHVFGISLPAFQVAGGMVLVFMGFIMLRGNPSPTSAKVSEPEDEKESEAQPADSSLTPLIFRVGKEERMMLDRFGSEYERYMQRTGRLFPRRG
jgi:multiple antibiotic resistance protein